MINSFIRKLTAKDKLKLTKGLKDRVYFLNVNYSGLGI